MAYILSIIFSILAYRWWIFFLIMFLFITYIFLYEGDKIKGIQCLGLFLFFFLYTFFRFDNVPSGNIVERGIVTNVDIYEDTNRYTLSINPFKKILFYSNDDRIKVGMRITVKGLVKDFSEETMPLLFNEKIYQNSIGINYKINLKEAKVEGLSLRYYLDTFRNKLKNIFDDNLSPLASNISKSVTLKYKENNLMGDKLNFFGLSHIMSVSGLHVGIIYLFIYYLVGLIVPFIKPRTFLSLIFIWLYGYMLNFPISLLRALIMISSIEYGKLYNPYFERIHSLKFAFVTCLLINPMYLFNIGFLLSFSSVLSIFLIYPELLKISSKKDKITKLIILNISIQLLTLPIIIYNFNSINVLTILWNIIYIPIFSLYIWLSFAFMILGRLVVVGDILGFALNKLALLFDRTLTIFSFKIFKPVFASPSIFLIILYYIAIFIFYYRKEINLFNLKHYQFIFGVMILFFVLNIFLSSRKNRIYFMDIGQGDGTLLSISGKNYLIDTGGDPFNKDRVGKRILEPFLIKHGFRNIDAVFISHFDYDHCGALTEISDDIKIDKVICDHKNKTDIKFSETLTDKFIRVKPGSKFILDKHYSLHSFEYKKNPSNENNSSMVLLLKKDNINICLFTGDIEGEVEKQLENKKIKSLLLKVSHHGSKHGSTYSFVKKVSPKYAIISVGKNNTYGHPSKEALGNLKKNKAIIYRTDQNGLISYDLDSYSMSTYAESKDIKYPFYILINIILYGVLIFEIRRIDWITQNLLTN